jgi:tRNA(Ile)-lysidine synthase
VSKRRVSINTAVLKYIPKGVGVLVAVSGGRDSMVLLTALLANLGALRGRLEVAHVDHGLRPNSGDDARFVAESCARLGVPCRVVKLASGPGAENVEAWARRERYAALNAIVEERGLEVIVTAHNANDVAETLLMRLIAKKELNSIEQSDPLRRVVRPFLEISREQIDDYVREFHVPFVEDPTNIDTGFVRNRIRHELLPLLAERFDPSIVWILAEQARTLAQDSEALRAVAAGVADEIGAVRQMDPQWLSVCRERLSTLPHGIGWRAVQALFAPLLGFVVGESKAAAIMGVLSGRDSSVDLGGGRSLEVRQGGVRLLG